MFCWFCFVSKLNVLVNTGLIYACRKTVRVAMIL
jgi:hypothetical protein